jgi:glycosyltransferase involved in cell wall biosynthesis
VIRLLTFSTLYPNAVQPNHGIFVETRLRHLLASHEADSRVVAPVAWFPSGRDVFGRYGEYARVPLHERRQGIAVDHPRYLAIPKVGMRLAPMLLARAALPAFLRLRAEGYDFDAIDAHYFYPDGVAAEALGRRLDRPVVITARGSDINLIAELRGPRVSIRRAAADVAAIIAVSQPLRDKIVGLGVDEAKIRVLRNGVDLERFCPIDRMAARADLGIDLGPGPVLASVGNLVPEKGHDLVIEALGLLRGTRLLVVGGGAQRSALRTRARSLGLGDRVHFVDRMPQEQLARLYSAVDALVLGSRREGWPNVLLEALACGTPVVAMDVGAAADIVRTPEAGRLVRERTATAVATAVRELLHDRRDRQATRRYAERFSWDETTRGQIEIFSQVIARSNRQPLGVEAVV